MSFQRVILNPLRRFTQGDQTAHDGVPPTWDRDDLPTLPEGQEWFEIQSTPEYDAATQRVEQVLDLETKQDSWRVVDLTPEEIAARQPSPLPATPLSIIDKLVALGKWEDFEAALAELPTYVEKSFYAAQEINQNHPLFITYSDTFKTKLNLTDDEFDSLLFRDVDYTNIF